jgi:23S rRNA pseudouridine1911/1915/1917 synthase
MIDRVTSVKSSSEAVKAKEPQPLRVSVPQARLDQFLALRFPALSLARIRQAIKAGAVRVNGRRTIQGWVVKAGDMVNLPEEFDARSAPDAPPLEVIHEDDDLLVINKPVGLQTHPTGAGQPDTLMDALATHLLKQADGGKDLMRPMLLHRLDRDTSGVLAVAKSPRAARVLSKAFQERRVTKRYLALVHGLIKDDGGLVDAPIGENKRARPHWHVTPDGSPAQTRFAVKERFARHTLVELEPLTGRTHQLRIHCAHVGHPVVGDRIYKGESARPGADGLGAKRQLLHAHGLTFRHPATGREVMFAAPLPQDLYEAIERLRAEDA